MDAPAPPAPPAANRVQRRALVPADLQRSGDSWERVLRRLAAEEASRQARRRNPWYSEER